MSRTPDLDESSLSPREREVFDRIASGPRGRVAGPLRVWLRSPEFADRAQALGQFARFDSSLLPILSELAILVTARIWSSGFEWSHHAPVALRAGLPSDALDAIARGRRPALGDAAQQAVFDFAVELHRDRQVSDAAFAAAEKALGMRGIVDLVGICGYYTLISMTINAFELPADGDPGLPEIDLPLDQLFREPS